jgi:hypothetical protein
MSGLLGKLIPSRGGSGENQSTDGSEDEDLPSEKEMHKRVTRAERRMDKARKSIEDHTSNYKQHLMQGAQSNNPGQRRVHAIRARFEKFKAKVQEIRRLKALKDLSQWTVAMESNKIDDMVDDIDDSSSVAEAAIKDSEEMQTMIDDLVADLQADLAEMDDVMSMADVDISGVGIQATEEEALMDSLAKNEADVEDVGLDVESLSVTEEDVSPMGDIDMDLNQEADASLAFSE